MVKLIVKNLKEVDEASRKQAEEIIKSKVEFYEQLFKKYGKELTLEVIFDNSSSLTKVSASINLKSKKVLLTEENKEVLKAITTLFNEFKKAVKRQYEMERKDYEYKRKR